MLLDNYDLVAMAMAPVPSAMRSVMGTRAVMVVVLTRMMTAAFDHDGLRVRNRRGREDDRAERGNNVSKLLHSIPILQLSRHSTAQRGERSRGIRREF
jgi:hypothetical protein